MTTVYLNGDLLPADEARVSVMDRGFLFGDGVYEVVPVFGRRCFRFDQHLDRLERSLRETHIPQPHTRAEWLAICERLIATEPDADQVVYLQVTRGAAPLREHRFPEGVRPTVFGFSRAAPVPAAVPAGISCITREDIRWQRCDIKSVSLLANVLLVQQALDAGSQEAILVRDGEVLEGAASNVFAVLDGVLYTAPEDRRILAGITRDLIVELAGRHGLAVREQAVRSDDLRRASEVWITSSTWHMAPVIRLDGVPVGSGVAGPVFARVWGWYRTMREQLRAAED